MLLVTHILAGSVALVLFWPILFFKKGDSLHTRLGRLFVLSLKIVVITALAICLFNLFLMDHTIQKKLIYVLLLYLSLATYSHLQLGVSSSQRRSQPNSLDDWAFRLQVIGNIVLGIAVGVTGIYYKHRVLIAMAPIGIYVGINNFIMVRKFLRAKINWRVIHIESMIGAATAAYAAFTIFGLRSLEIFSEDPKKTWISWVIAPAIGVPLGKYLGNKVNK